LNKRGIFTSLAIVMGLSACTPIHTPMMHQYKLESYSKQPFRPPLHRSLLIAQPEAIAGYQTEQMLYSNKPFQLAAFSENAWIGTPANMLYPLLIQTFQNSHAFSAIASSPYADRIDYRIDTQLIDMQQNFLVKPSEFHLKLKVVVTRVSNNHILASRIFFEHIPCPADTPYGGVVAGNKATLQMTQKIKQFVIMQIQQDT
jgi:cholesterol transport system auxiliary component